MQTWQDIGTKRAARPSVGKALIPLCMLPPCSCTVGILCMWAAWFSCKCSTCNAANCGGCGDAHGGQHCELLFCSPAGVQQWWWAEFIVYFLQRSQGGGAHPPPAPDPGTVLTCSSILCVHHACTAFCPAGVLGARRPLIDNMIQDDGRVSHLPARQL